MANPDLYTKPVEQLMVEGKISVWYVGSGKWTAHSLNIHGRGWIEGAGETPRDAIIDLYKKLK